MKTVDYGWIALAESGRHTRHPMEGRFHWGISKKVIAHINSLQHFSPIMNYPKSNKAKPKPLRIISPLHKANRQLSICIGSLFHHHDLLPGDAHVLSYLQLYAPCPIAELIRVFGHRKPTMTSLLDRLEKRRLIARTLNPKDRRSFLVKVTKHGDKTALAARRCVDLLDARIAKKVGSKELKAFNRVMNAVAEITGVDVRPVAKAVVQSKQERKK